jgi:integrase
LRAKSIEHAAKGYGWFLASQAAHGPLDPALGPAGRVTLASVASYVDFMRARQNKNRTIKSRLFHLRTALRIMVPAAEFDWITRPDGVSLAVWLPDEPVEKPFLPTTRQLFDWGLEMMQIPIRADGPAAPHQRLQLCRAYRNGLMIAILACLAPRVGSLSKMRLEKNLFWRSGEHWVRLQGSIVKNKRDHEYAIPPQLTPYVSRYLAEIRPLLLDPSYCDAVWGNGQGGALSAQAVQTMLFRESLKKFGHGFGPHIARHALASSLASADPLNPGLAAVVLGVSEGVVQAHYRQARQRDAALQLQQNLREERERTQAAAQRAFTSRR